MQVLGKQGSSDRLYKSVVKVVISEEDNVTRSNKAGASPVMVVISFALTPEKDAESKKTLSIGNKPSARLQEKNRQYSICEAIMIPMTWRAPLKLSCYLYLIVGMVTKNMYS